MGSGSQVRSWRPALFWGSVLLNIALIGLIAFKVMQPPFKGPPPPEKIVAFLSDRLGPEDKAIFETALKPHMPKFKAAAGTMREAVVLIMGEIRREPFDPERVIAAERSLREKRDNVTNQLIGPLANALAQISPEGRRRISDFPGTGSR